MNSRPDDARLRELIFLAEINRTGGKAVRHWQDSTERQMVASLLAEGYLNGLDTLPWQYHSDFYNLIHRDPLGECNPIVTGALIRQWQAMNQLLGGQDVSLYMCHKGRVRLSELEQAFKTGRDRDSFGILLDGRYLERDLAIALARVAPERPLSVAYMDMNGLKVINDTHGHEVGDRAIRAYLQTIAMVVETTGEAYRKGGDEVVILLEAMPLQSAKESLLTLLKRLRAERVEPAGALRASAGLVESTNPGENTGTLLLKAADEAMYRAKAASKKWPERPSALSVGGEPPVLVE